MNKKDILAGGGVTGCVLLVLTISGIIGMFCWPYTINSWLIFMGKEPVIVWWQGFLLGYVPFMGQTSIPALVITWVLMLFLVG